MADENLLMVGFINVVATPHPPGVYPSALKQAANTPVRYRGRDYAVILPPSQNSEDKSLWEGSIRVWTDIDANEPSIDKATFESKNVEKALADIFAVRGFNHRGFSYVLDDKTHTIAVELRTESGKTLSPRQAGKIFEIAFSSLNRKGQTFEVTVRPEEDALEKVLGFDRLDRITIYLKRPNPGDHHGDDANQILRELEEQNMKQAEYEFVRQAGTDGIHLNEQNRTKAVVAAQNGFVAGAGVDENGERERRSTKEYPRVIRRAVTAGTTFITALRNEAKRFRVA